MADKMAVNVKDKFVLKNPHFKKTNKVYQSAIVHVHNPAITNEGGGGLAQIKRM